VFLTNTKQEVMEVLTGPERRRRWSAEEKLAMVRESFEPGKSVSMVARQHGVNPNQLFHWRKLYQDGSLSAVSAGEEVVPATGLSDALKQIRELAGGVCAVEVWTLCEPSAPRRAVQVIFGECGSAAPPLVLPADESRWSMLAVFSRGVQHGT
jgi:transposase